MSDNIEEIVRQYVNFHGIASGWNVTYCEVCGDGSRTKGPRGGWRFDGDMCGYHCFNCGIKGSFDPQRDYAFSKDMKEIFDGFGIPAKDYNYHAYKFKILENGKPKIAPKKKLEIKTLPIPDYFYKLSDAKDGNMIAQKALEELKYRNLDPNAYTFYLSSGISKQGPRDSAIAKSLMNRLIIPYFDKDDNMIYYQGLDLTKKARNKYMNADTPRTNILFGMDKLYERNDNPLFVTEGFFDAFPLNGIALLENSITAGQIEMLKKCPRQKVFVPDKKSDSMAVVNEFKKQGWYVSIPDFGSSVKDVDDAIRKFGKLYTISEVAGKIYPAHDAEIYMSLNGFLINN